MKPPIPVSPLAWWLLQIALSALLLRWTLRVLRGTALGLLVVAAGIWAYVTVPGFAAAVHHAWATVLPVLRAGSQQLVDGLRHIGQVGQPTR